MRSQKQLLIFIISLSTFFILDIVETYGRNIIRIGQANPKCTRIGRQNPRCKTIKQSITKSFRPNPRCLTIEETFNNDVINWKALHERKKCR